MQAFLNQSYFSNTIQDYLIFLVSIIVSLIVITIFKLIIIKRLNRWAEKTKTMIDDLIISGIRKYLTPLLYIGAIYLNTKVLYLHPTLEKIINIAVLAVITILAATFVSSVFVFIFNKYWENKNPGDNKIAMRWISTTIRLLIWVAALLLFLENIDVHVTALVAGLGVGGIAIAFAAQALLEDFFSFFTIFFDRPFEIGDFIIVGDMMGTVDHIGIKTTRLKSISGEQLIFSNKDLTNSRVKNYKRMEKRRVLFTLGVTYDTPLEKLKVIPSIIKNIIDEADDATFDRAHFASYGDFSLNFETVYYVMSNDYNKYMDIQQIINFKLKEEFDATGIEFAFPTQTLYVQNSSEPVSAGENA